MVEFAILANYGVLGLWTISLLFKERTVLKDLRIAISENTRVLELLERTIALKK